MSSAFAVDLRDLRCQGTVDGQWRGRAAQIAQVPAHQRLGLGRPIARDPQPEAHLLRQPGHRPLRQPGHRPEDLDVILMPVFAPGPVGDHGLHALQADPQPVLQFAELTAIAVGIEAVEDRCRRPSAPGGDRRHTRSRAGWARTRCRRPRLRPSPAIPASAAERPPSPPCAPRSGRGHPSVRHRPARSSRPPAAPTRPTIRMRHHDGHPVEDVGTCHRAGPFSSPRA